MDKFGKNDWLAGDAQTGGAFLHTVGDFFAAVSLGLLPRYSRVITRGNNPDIDTGTLPEDIWSGGGTYPWITTAAPLEVVSDSAADAAAGTGMRTMTISGLTSAYVPVTETVTLNGTTPVALTTQFFRINRLDIVTAGSGMVNAGNVSVRTVSGATVRAVMPAGYGTDRQSQFTVPAGCTLLVYQTTLSINRPSSTRDATVSFYSKGATEGYKLLTEVSVDGQPFIFDRIVPFAAPEKTDVGLRCTYASADNTNLTGAIVGILRNNS